MAKVFDIAAWRGGRRVLRRRSRDRFTVLVLAGLAVPVLVALASGIGGADAVGRLGTMLELAPAAAGTGTVVSARFEVCSSAQRYTCVVDGDTIWVEGTRIRIADLDAPEIAQPGCEAEAQRGIAARDRLADLLSAAPFEVAPADRDEDRFGRKLRILVRDGRSLADDLVRQGLAGYWGTGPHAWC